MKDVVAQCEYETTHTHYKEYKEIRTQKFNTMRFYFVKNNIKASF